MPWLVMVTSCLRLKEKSYNVSDGLHFALSQALANVPNGVRRIT
jgi:hypothetical protein